MALGTVPARGGQMRSNRILHLVIAVSCLCGIARASAPADDEFAKKAALDGMTEVELGRMASTKGQSAAVKSFGQRMVTDHTKAGNKLKATSARAGVTLPTELDTEHRAMVDRISQL